MNKQEALEALLTKCRQWEQRGAEVPATSHPRVQEALNRNVDRLRDMLTPDSGVAYREGEFGAALITIGAAALFLLIDDWSVVEGKDLDAWLAEAPQEVHS